MLFTNSIHCWLVHICENDEKSHVQCLNHLGLIYQNPTLGGNLIQHMKIFLLFIFSRHFVEPQNIHKNCIKMYPETEYVISQLKCDIHEKYVITEFAMHFDYISFAKFRAITLSH